jgi:predicted Rossmann fold flavoprotein
VPQSAHQYPVIDDLIVIGAGAAGLATAIFAARRAPALRVRCVDGARNVGAKILVSGGSRCNVTNRVVTEHDFWGGSPRIVRQVLRAFPAERAANFFADLGVGLHEEADGKLFPDTNRSRTVLDALLKELERLHVFLEPATRVVDLQRADDAFVITSADGRRLRARAVVLATGGQSLPKSGSDGAGYRLAQHLGHRIVPTTPALAPLLLEDDWHAALSGVAHRAEASIYVEGRLQRTLSGDWLWTHFGASGPLALNVSRHWHRSEIEGTKPDLLLSLCPGQRFDEVEARIVEQSRIRPRAQVLKVISSQLPASVGETWLRRLLIDPAMSLAHLKRDDRRRLVHALTGTRLHVRGSRGYQYAEVTAGGVALDEIDPTTLESRICAGLYLAGEILDVDGRLGGFNFQWAWSSGFVVGQAVAAASNRIS